MLKFFQLVLVLLVDVVQIFGGDDALEALVLLFGFGVKGRWCIVSHAIDAESALWVYLFSLKQKGVVNDGLANVSFHVCRGSILLIRIDHILDHFKSTRVFIFLV